MNSPFSKPTKRKADDESPSNHTPSKRKVINAQIKLSIINDSKTFSNSELACKYQLAKSTISTILNPSRKKKLIDLYESNNLDLSVKHLKFSTYPDIENA